MNRTPLFLLGLILVFAAAVRAYALSDLGFWTDELCTLSEAQGHGLELLDVPADRIVAPAVPVRTRLAMAAPAWRIIPGLRRDDVHPPLYLLLVRGWEAAFGDSEAAVRSLGVCFSVAAVGLLFAAARPAVGSTAALWACLLMAVASPQVTFAQEARGYAPVLTFALAAAVAQRRLLDRPTAGRAAVLAGCLLAMMLTHYYAAGVAVALAVDAALTARGRHLAGVAGAYAGATVLFGVVWGPSLLHQLPHFRTNDLSWMVDPGPGHATRVLIDACRLPVRWVADVRTPATAVGGVLLLALPVLFVARPPLRLWVLWVAVPTAVVVAGDLLQHTRQMTLTRYTFFATPGVYVLVAGAVRGRARWVMPAVATVAAVASLPNAYVPAWKVDYRTPAAAITARLGPADGLVVSGPDRIAASVAYAGLQHYLPHMPAASALLTRPADAATLDSLRQCPRVWVVWLWPGKPITAFVPGYRTADAGPLPPAGEIATGRVVMTAPR